MPSATITKLSKIIRRAATNAPALMVPFFGPNIFMHNVQYFGLNYAQCGRPSRQTNHGSLFDILFRIGAYPEHIAITISIGDAQSA